MADAELDAHWIGLVVDHREKRLLLPTERLEVAEAAVIGVVLKCGCPTFGEIVGYPSRRSEIRGSQPLERSVEDGI